MIKAFFDDTVKVLTGAKKLEPMFVEYKSFLEKEYKVTVSNLFMRKNPSGTVSLYIIVATKFDERIVLGRDEGEATLFPMRTFAILKKFMSLCAKYNNPLGIAMDKINLICHNFFTDYALKICEYAERAALGAVRIAVPQARISSLYHNISSGRKLEAIFVLETIQQKNKTEKLKTAITRKYFSVLKDYNELAFCKIEDYVEVVFNNRFLEQVKINWAK